MVKDLGARGILTATEQELEACADEPIHIPGAIQPHGVLVAAVDLKITHVSANLESLTGGPAAAAIGSNLADIIGQDTLVALQDALAAEHYAPVSLLQQSLNFPGPDRYNLLCHRSDNRVIVEIEPADPQNTKDSVLALTQSLFAKLRQKRSLLELCGDAARELRRLTGYDRVMVYRFDEAGNGEVVAEDRVPEIEPFLGLHYPASDIPAQARRLYMLQRVRVLPDVDYQPAPILAHPGLKTPDLDMSHCMLRAFSPVHLEYLRNMNVGATLAISIIQEQTLWGMVLCHHRTSLKPYAWINSLCDLLGQLLGLLVGEITEREKLTSEVERQNMLGMLTNDLETRPSIAESLVGQEENMLRLVDSDGMVIWLGGKTRSHGKVPTIETALEIFARLRPDTSDAIATVDNLGEQYPEFLTFKDSATGALVLPVGTNKEDGIIWFRPELLSTIKWGGEPLNKAQIDVATKRISPRQSFDIWRQIVFGKARPWSQIDIKSARDLRRILTRALLRHSEAELFRISNTDSLTGLANRTVLNQQLEAWGASDPPIPAALLFLDLDRFKTVNDSIGHFAGDELLHETAQRLSMLGQDGHLVVRLGGDEFVVFAQNFTEPQAEALAQKILALFDKPFVAQGRPYRATTSIGIACALTGHNDLMRDADAAMYAAKRLGGNRAVLFKTTMRDVARDRLRTEQDLLMSIERAELTVHYQPVVALPIGITYAYEALARWRHPEFGWIAPVEFIKLAEEIGQIEQIGSWIARQAIHQLACLSDQTLKMSINVSVYQLRLGGIIDDIIGALSSYRIAPNRIIIEVTESGLMDDMAVRSLEKFRDLGFEVAIDDFGTGYSSLAYLTRVPATKIKIDRSFVMPLGFDPKAELFLGTIINLAHILGMKVVAEGVETSEQRDVLSRLSCDSAQGYLFGKPQPFDSGPEQPPPSHPSPSGASAPPKSSARSKRQRRSGPRQN
jgi:diguanylate cyclase (GGDEF)-like protein